MNHRTKMPSYNNVLSICMLDKFYDAALNEGLIQTYDPQQTVRYIKDYFNMSDDEIYNTELNTIIVSTSDINDEFLNKLDKAFNLCGYYKAITDKGDEKIEIQYEPKYIDPIENVLRKKEHFLLHLSPTKYKEKILKNGFVPKSKNSTFDYPDRVYFLRESIPTKNLIEMLKVLSSKNKNSKYSIFKIDLNKIPLNVKFYSDLNYNEYGVFTYDNINANAIIKINDIDLEYLFGKDYLTMF